MVLLSVKWSYDKQIDEQKDKKLIEPCKRSRGDAEIRVIVSVEVSQYPA